MFYVWRNAAGKVSVTVCPPPENLYDSLIATCDGWLDALERASDSNSRL